MFRWVSGSPSQWLEICKSPPAFKEKDILQDKVSYALDVDKAFNKVSTHWTFMFTSEQYEVLYSHHPKEIGSMEVTT